MALSSVMVKLKTDIEMPVYLGPQVQKIPQWRGSEGMRVTVTMLSYYYEVNVIKLNFWFSKINHEHWVARRMQLGRFKDN